MNTNRKSSYLKYAIGEIILVVIGILIALQINNWNTERKDRKKEAVLLRQIHRDFKSNRMQLDTIIKSNLKMKSSLNILLQTMAETRGPRLIDTLFKYGDDIAPVKTFNPSNGAVEALIYSSSLELITNDSLRNLLVSWKDVYNDYSEEEEFSRNFQQDHLLPFFRKRFNSVQPYSKSNLELVKTLEFENIWLEKLRNVEGVLKAVKGEMVEDYINEILRLTEHYD